MRKQNAVIAHYAVVNKLKISPFKFQFAGDGEFINTTRYGAKAKKEYAVTQTIHYPDKTTETIRWPSAEHAFHAQKVIDYINKHPSSKSILQKMLYEIRDNSGVNGEFLPRDCYDPIAIRYAKKLGLQPIVDKQGTSRYDWVLAEAFEATNKNQTHEVLNRARMKRVLRLKLQQHPELAEKASLYAANGIMPIEVSRHDSTWASGANGDGKNLLGIDPALVFRTSNLNNLSENLYEQSYQLSIGI